MQDNTQSDKLKSFFAARGLSNQAIADILGGVSKQLVGAYINGRKPFGKEQAKKWEYHFGLSRTWLLTGEGSMLVGDAAPAAQPLDAPQLAAGTSPQTEELRQALAIAAKAQEQADRLLRLLEQFATK